ncbi:hypothetical protein [Nitrosomonas ureae]|uniref:Uncharacterized protein n=1 Tax=Nitrosomonas ureae TaxID=44577 RepID=A0A286A2X1_9PROT|nr:hypothetical protein [Nitrosomonas ureae]SOD16245.1 hypothetical protein SAMN06297164_0312 [Nitrosomonas ureae]
MRAIITALIIFSSLTINTAHAKLKVTTPSEVCAYLKDFGLATRGWKNHYENVYGCSSPYKELGSGFPLANNLAFYVEDDNTTARQTKLVLNVNNCESEKPAHEELLKAAEALSVKATGESLPKTLRDAIKTGKNTTAKVGSAFMEVIRENMPTGKGYEIKVLIN